MKATYRKGISFGVTSGVITTLGLMVGLDAATSSKLAVSAGIVSIAIADALSDAVGIHLFEEVEKRAKRQIWESSGATFLAKLIFALTFLIPIILFNLATAVLVGVIWGLLLITVLSYKIAKRNKEKPLRAISSHLLLTLVVLVITRYVGLLVAMYF